MKFVGYKFISDKTAIGTAPALLDVLSSHPRPCAIWTDNGIEFKSSFDILVRQTGILHAFTAAYSIQHNGVCER
jgi:hypothetical protein